MSDHSAHHGHNHSAAAGESVPDVANDILNRDVAAFMNDLTGGAEGVPSADSAHAGHDHAGHAHHGHGSGHGDGGHGHDGHMMKMWFHGGYEEVILFDFWRIDSLTGMLLSCALIFVMGAAYEGLKWWRVRLSMQLSRTVSPLSSRRFYSLALPALYVIQLILAYWLMLIVMTYNTYLTAAVILGAGFGHWIFAVMKPFAEGGDELATDACH